VPEYRIAINNSSIRVEAGSERSALCGLLRRLTSVVAPSTARPITVEVKRGEAWELCSLIECPNELDRALVAAGVSIAQAVWYLDEGRAALPKALPLTEWKLIESSRRSS
jgi:hypothetical protein